jgi:hypothetical protein
MRRIGTALMAVAVSGGTWLCLANAAPPTVVPSPGYDARLQEQRAQLAHEGLDRSPQSPMPHRRKRHHSAVR